MLSRQFDATARVLAGNDIAVLLLGISSYHFTHATTIWVIVPMNAGSSDGDVTDPREGLPHVTLAQIFEEAGDLPAVAAYERTIFLDPLML